jgi:hypothetical protein
MTNAMVEIGLISVSVVLSLIGLPAGVIGMVAGAAMAWWLIVHNVRFNALIKSAPLKAISSFAIAILVIGVVHGLAFGLGYAFHSMMDLK